MPQHVYKLFLLAFLATGCSVLENAKDSFFRLVLTFVPISVDQEVGASAGPQAVAGRRVAEDPAINEQLAKLTKPLFAAARDSGFTFTVRIVDDPSLNAFALPGGYLYMHTGLIENAGSVEEVLGVLAHETAHVTERHTMESMMTNLGLRVAAAFVMAELGSLGDVLVQGGYQLASLGFSRSQESEADRKGFDFLVKAGLDPRGMVGFFQRLLKSQKQTGKGFTMLRTHPATTDRIAAMEARLATWHGNPQPFNFNFPKFREDVKNWSSHP